MQPHGTFEITPRHVFQWTDFHDAGVVDQDVDLAKSIDNFLNRGLNLTGIEQISFNPESIRGATAPTEIDLCALQFFRVPRNDGNLTALRADMPGKHESESSRPAGDDGNLVAQRITRGANGASGYPSAD